MSETQVKEIDLLDPRESLLHEYRNQIRHTIDAYSEGHIVVAEKALQNALDAIAEKGSGDGLIDIHIDFDSSKVIVSDNGVGFPNDPRLLILGGSDKKKSSRTTAGMVGVGIKVVMYCSDSFSIKSKTAEGSWCVEINNACEFAENSSLKLCIPKPFPDDPNPRADQGTTISYSFPKTENTNDCRMWQFAEHVRSRLVDPSIGEKFGYMKTLDASGTKTIGADLMSAYLRRFTYAGDTLGPLGGRDGLTGTRISFTLTASDPSAQMGSFWGGKWEGGPSQTIEFEPSYLTVAETVKLTKVKRPGIYDENLGNGGENLDRTASGFNVTTYTNAAEYKKLLKNRKGELPANLPGFESKLFKAINCIEVTIGRIPQFNDYLPHGSRRVLSANGVVTEHDIAISSGRNQQYVRCVDIVLDLDAQLNYGKTHLVNNHLVAIAREFINGGVPRTLQSAASRFVGKIAVADDDEEQDVYWAREDLPAIANIPLAKVPRDENDVIALFVSFITAGHLLDYRIYGLSQQDRYDARMLIKRESDRSDLMTSPKEVDLKVVEFKLLAASVVKDFESEIKDPKDLNLVIAWDNGSISGTRFSIEDIVHCTAYKSSPRKVFPGVAHYIYDNKTAKELQLLLLKPLIESELVQAAE